MQPGLCEGSTRRIQYIYCPSLNPCFSLLLCIYYYGLDTTTNFIFFQVSIVLNAGNMKLQSVWTGILYVFDLISLSPQGSKPLPETPLPAVPLSSIPVPAVSEIPHKFDDDDDATSLAETPIINVPRREGDFNCSYPKLKEFENCHKPGNRSCWLRHRRRRWEYNIETDYDNVEDVPEGIVRDVNLY